MANSAFSDGFVQLCIDPSLNTIDGKCRVLVEGQYFNGGANLPADTLVHVTSPRDVNSMFGSGSVLSESIRKIFCQCPENIDLFVIPRADPAGSVAAEYTLTVAGPATSDGRVELYLVEGDYSINFKVDSGDTATQIAAEIVANLPLNFPYTATAAAGVVTLVAKNKGAVGNYLVPIYNWRNRTNYAPQGVTVTPAQTVVGSGALTPLNYANILGTCCYSCFAILTEDEAVQEAWQTYIESLWSCDSPQCFGHGYTYNSGDMSEVLATSSNAAVLSRLDACPGSGINPWLQTAAFAALSCCTACDSPEIAIQGRTNGVLSCLRVPAGCSSCRTFEEQQILKENGFVVSGPLDGGFGTYTNPYIFNDVTNYLYDDLGKENLTFRDANSRRLAAATATAIAQELLNFSGQALFTNNTTIKQGIAGTNIRMMLARMRAWCLSQVGVLFSEFDDINKDLTIKSDFETAPKCQGVPGRAHMFLRYRPPVRMEGVRVQIQPKVLDNCR